MHEGALRPVLCGGRRRDLMLQGLGARAGLVRRKRQADLQPFLFDLGAHPALHLLHELPHNGQPQPGPAPFSGGVALVEAVKEVGRVRCGAGAGPPL